MVATIKIPEGWRKLGNDEAMRAGDRYLLILGTQDYSWSWEPVTESIGLTPDGQMTAIRRRRVL